MCLLPLESIGKPAAGAAADRSCILYDQSILINRKALQHQSGSIDLDMEQAGIMCVQLSQAKLLMGLPDGMAQHAICLIQAERGDIDGVYRWKQRHGDERRLDRRGNAVDAD